jgi:lysosomal acid lipase/cholesteryl ester hydrolase
VRAGYDVWLGNARGNTCGRAHTHLSTASAAFWAFSFDDIADKDLPAMGNHILSTTGAASFAYIAHSQGTTVGLAALSADRAFAQQVQVGRGRPRRQPAPGVCCCAAKHQGGEGCT